VVRLFDYGLRGVVPPESQAALRAQGPERQR
jgi:hypothetical protein